MPEIPLLSDRALSEALKSLPDWRHDRATAEISREFAFADFKAAFGFMCQVALEAEDLGHHPDWFNSYNTVAVSLTTHNAGGLTLNDVKLAAVMDALYASGQGDAP